jgi:hypothetical protein
VTHPASISEPYHGIGVSSHNLELNIPLKIKETK